MRARSTMRMAYSVRCFYAIWYAIASMWRSRHDALSRVPGLQPALLNRDWSTRGACCALLVYAEVMGAGADNHA